MRKTLRLFSVALVALSCVWMFGALAKFAITGMLFGITLGHWMLAVWLIFASGLSGAVLGWMLYAYSFPVPPQGPPDVKAGNGTANG